MFKQFIRVALTKKVETFGSLIQMAVGLGAFWLSLNIVNYENDHDSFFKDADQIYAVQTNFKPEASPGYSSILGSYSALQPLLKASGFSAARLFLRENTVSVENRKFNEQIRYADPDFLEIFNLIPELQQKNRVGLNTNYIILTRDTALKWFGSTDVVGSVVTIDQKVELFVAAVIDELPANTHLKSKLFDVAFNAIASSDILWELYGGEPTGDWKNLDSLDHTYIKIPASGSEDLLQIELNRIFENLFPDRSKDFVEGLETRPLTQLNTWIWDSTQIPLIGAIQLAGVLILVLATLNYSNLAAARSLERAKEFGVRRVLGAATVNILAQLWREILVLTSIAGVMGGVFLEITVPPLNAALSKEIQNINLVDPTTWLAYVITLGTVALMASIYPAYVACNPRAIEMLGHLGSNRTRGSKMSSVFLAIQFGSSSLFVFLVTLVYLQNQYILSSTSGFNRDQTIVVNIGEKKADTKALASWRNELRAVKNFSNISYSSQVPFENKEVQIDASIFQKSAANSIKLNTIHNDLSFFDIYGVSFIEGEDNSRNQAISHAKETQPAILNEMAVKLLGYDSVDAVIGSTIYVLGRDINYRVTGIVEDKNFFGPISKQKPFIHVLTENSGGFASIRLASGLLQDTTILPDIQEVWGRVFSGEIFVARYLNDFFNDTYSVFEGILAALLAGAIISLIIASTGLHGIVSLRCLQLQRQMAIRRILGANTFSIFRLLLWKFLKPNLIALSIAIILGYLVGKSYLEFFSNAIEISGLEVVIVAAVMIFIATIVILISITKIVRVPPAIILQNPD